MNHKYSVTYWEKNASEKNRTDNRNESIIYKTIPYSEIIQAGVVIDENLVSKTSVARKVGGAAVGGLLAGSAGAVVGGTDTKRNYSKEIEKIELRLLVNDVNKPRINLKLNQFKLKKESQIEKIRDVAEDWKDKAHIIV